MLKQEDWRSSVDHAIQWQRDEPYSSRPAVQGSFIALSVTQDYLNAKELIQTFQNNYRK